MYNQHYNEKENPFDDSQQVNPQPIPLAAPRPGYAAPVSALMQPAPSATPDGRMSAQSEMSEFHGGMPSTPHPLQPPMTPIAPVFARPATAQSRDVKFAKSTPIMRGESEGTVLPRRGQQGDDFWKRFSMVAKDEAKAPKQSIWLRKTQNGSTRMSRWVWIVGMTLLIIIAGSIGLGWYVSHNDTSNEGLKALGGSANEKATPTSSSSAAAGNLATSSSLHVSPTRTVARREPEPIPTPFDAFPIEARAKVAVHKMHHNRRLLNRLD